MGFKQWKGWAFSDSSTLTVCADGDHPDTQGEGGQMELMGWGYRARVAGCRDCVPSRKLSAQLG